MREDRALVAGAGLALLAVLLAASVSLSLAWLAGFCGFALLLALSLRGPGGRRSSAETGGNEEATAEDRGKAFAVLPAAELAAAVPDPLLIFDRSGFVLHANPAAEEKFGRFAPNAALPLRFRAPEMQQLVESAVGAGAAVVGEYTERVPLERNFRVTASPLDTDGRLWALFFQDWSEARRADRMRADFVANASHELRTPLASIAGFTETLRGPARDDPRARERFLGIIGDQAARMSRLIDDLLSLSRLETKPYLSLAAQVDLAGVVRDVAASLAPLAAECGVTLESELPEGNWSVAGSRDELFQVVENLVENACNYGASGGRVRVALGRETDGGALLTVQDWGPGIAPEHLPRITERFYRVDAQSSRTKRGTGLGLAIVKHIVSRHRARLAVRSSQGNGGESGQNENQERGQERGTSFSVHFPPS